jgi:hypothetical protein
MRFYRVDGELISTDDDRLIEALHGRHPAVDARDAAAARRAGGPVIAWPGTVADLEAVLELRALPAGLRAVLAVRQPHTGVVRMLDDLTGRELLEAVVADRQAQTAAAAEADVD